MIRIIEIRITEDALYFDGCHGNVIALLPWQPYKWCTNLCKVMLIIIIPIVKNNNYNYYLWLIVVTMATIVVDYT